MTDETIIGCMSEFHGTVFCRYCILKFGHPECWNYRNKYHPMLIEDGYFKKFGEHDPRRTQNIQDNE